MASNVAENKDSRDWVAAQWWKSGDNTPDNLSGLSLYAVPALGQTTGFGKTNTPKFNSTELEGTVLFGAISCQREFRCFHIWMATMI